MIYNSNRGQHAPYKSGKDLIPLSIDSHAEDEYEPLSIEEHNEILKKFKLDGHNN